MHYKFADGQEMVEEYNMLTNVLTRRLWKTKKPIGGSDDQWEVEIGDPIPESQQPALETLGIKENSSAVSPKYAVYISYSLRRDIVA